MHTFWLVLTYDPLEDRRIDDVIIKTFFNSLLYKTNRFQVAMRLFSNRSQMTSKCGKNKQVAHKAQPSVSLMFLPHFWRPLWSITEQMCVTSVTHSAAPHVPLFCSYHILTSSVIYYWTNARQLGIYLLSTIGGKITIIKKHDEIVPHSLGPKVDHLCAGRHEPPLLHAPISVVVPQFLQPRTNNRVPRPIIKHDNYFKNNICRERERERSF